MFAGDVLELLFDGVGDGADMMLLNGDWPNGENLVGLVCAGAAAALGKVDTGVKPANDPLLMPVGCVKMGPGGNPVGCEMIVWVLPGNPVT